MSDLDDLRKRLERAERVIELLWQLRMEDDERQAEALRTAANRAYLKVIDAQQAAAQRHSDAESRYRQRTDWWPE